MAHDIVIDVEADNLLPMTKVIHVVVVKLIGKPEDNPNSYRVCRTPDDLRRIIPHAGKVVMHNGLGFDLWAISRVWGIPFTVNANGKDTWAGHSVSFVDTCHISQYLNPDRIGGHSLEAWGERVQLQKIDHTDFSVYTDEMLVYCKRDCAITERAWHRLQGEIKERESV